ncbi:flagellar rod assembly protein/muramidase FlgJ [Antarctobacter heliothermus]|uniref:Flagellar rod assembly protein/muramidase FlgJ n=1 Tax=Antarctobacter heliothermus TaxID=74033 RepID=A0A222E1E3_9RHOB|nr:rod-binding protein [Antarctobacter heliothermus]ASP19788.1 flagellar rod assembly protein/muramidase FlgJ [Antarctobacter heliothermus]
MEISLTQPGPLPPQDRALRDAARELEANFLAEMLKAAKVGETPEGFGGGEGENQFTSFMRLEQARQMTEGGGIGLAESLFHALKERAND